MPDQFILSPSQLGNLLTSLQPHYPNQEEITSPSISYKTATIMAVKGWRNNTWKTAKSGDEATKITALQGLVTALNTVYTKTVSLVLDTEAPQGAHYHPESNTIHLNKPSIITTLPSQPSVAATAAHYCCRLFLSAAAILALSGPPSLSLFLVCGGSSANENEALL